MRERLDIVDPTAVILKMLATFPDGLIPISAIFAVVTLSYPMAVFSASMLEAALLFKALQVATGYLGIFSGVGYSQSSSNICRTGFSSGSALSFKTLSLFEASAFSSPFPSPHIFMISAAVSYVFLSIDAVSNELQALGTTWAARWWVSLIFSSFLILLMILFRASFSCDSVSIIMLSTMVGILTGVALIRQNTHLFGKDGINLIGTPLLAKKGANGEAIYLCQTQK
jgi:hypothetical protein